LAQLFAHFGAVLGCDDADLFAAFQAHTQRGLFNTTRV
jgi:hypothetical protein